MKPAEASPARGRALSRPAVGYGTFAAIAVIGCAVDLLTKQWMFAWRGFPDPHVSNVHWLWKPYVGVETSLNPGALFGFGAGNSHWFAGLSIVAAIGIILWLSWGRAVYDRWLTIALGAVMAGIFGNLYDRLGLWHFAETPDAWKYNVRDWILLRYEPYTWPNFNIADSLLVCGAAILIVHAFLQPVKEPENKPAKL